MQTYIARSMEARLSAALASFPAVALIGPRQCGKSTLAREFEKHRENALFLDLESPADLARLDDAEYYLAQHAHELVCIDEVQRSPELFTILRVLIDRARHPGRFLLLGSASPELLRQSSESLAGRIAYLELSPFHYDEVAPETPLSELWGRGGFPDSLLAERDEMSSDWREQFIRTFLERDLPGFGYSLPGVSMRRFWTMLAHYHGQALNYSKLGQSMDVSDATIRRWLRALEQTFMVRLLPPLEVNTKKRLVKSPKMYIRDTGIVHRLLDLRTWDELMGHPIVGASWEGFVVETVANLVPDAGLSFYRTSSGAEIDLIIERRGRRVGIECKLSIARRLSKALPGSMVQCDLETLLVVTPEPGEERLRPGVELCSLCGLSARLESLLG
ncbi:MAG: ATPase [Gemmatimonadetes bacterium]|nr:ATPase [Gemmatimonadota bacterium]